jgi:hypothetical protein
MLAEITTRHEPAMSHDAPLEVRIVDRALAADASALAAAVQGAPPRFTAHLVSAARDLLTLQLARGTPGEDPAALFHLKDLGTYELVRLERWPPRAPGGSPRVLLVLRAWRPA